MSRTANTTNGKIGIWFLTLATEMSVSLSKLKSGQGKLDCQAEMIVTMSPPAL